MYTDFYESQQQSQNDKTLPKWKLPQRPLTGYTGDIMRAHAERDEGHPLDFPYRRRMIRGYSGFIPDGKGISGRPIIPSDEEQRIQNEISLGTYQGEPRPQYHSTKTYKDDFSCFREYAKDMDRIEHYNEATKKLLARGQSPEMLIQIVQAKISERMQSYAQQLISVRREFEQYIVDPDEGFNDRALREVLERMNIQLDDVQALALFAFFDVEGRG